MKIAAFRSSVPPFPRSCLAHRTGDPSIFARPPTERNRDTAPFFAACHRARHTAVADFRVAEANAAFGGCHNSLKVLLSPPRPSRNKRAMTPFSAKQPRSGSQSERGLTRSAATQPRLNALKQILTFNRLCRRGDSVLVGGKNAQSWRLGVRRLLNFASQRRRLTLNKLLCEPLLFVHPEEPESAKAGPCAKVHPPRPIGAGNGGAPARRRRNGDGSASFDGEKLRGCAVSSRGPRWMCRFMLQNARRFECTPSSPRRKRRRDAQKKKKVDLILILERKCG